MGCGWGFPGIPSSLAGGAPAASQPARVQLVMGSALSSLHAQPFALLPLGARESPSVMFPEHL